jgi:hypothetical protein
MKLTFTGITPLTKTNKSIGRELDGLIEAHYKESWASHSTTIVRTTDLCSFKAKGNQAHEYICLGSVRPGDHIGEYMSTG